MIVLPSSFELLGRLGLVRHPVGPFQVLVEVEALGAFFPIPLGVLGDWLGEPRSFFFELLALRFKLLALERELVGLELRALLS